MAPKVKNNTVYTMVESPTKTTGINTGKSVKEQKEAWKT